MLILGIETATPDGGAALWKDGAIVAAAEGADGATHSERLLPGIERCLREARCALRDLDAIAVSIGPGSFTGLRIGLSVAKSLAAAADKPVVAAPTLEALAWRFAEPGIPAAPLLDARRGEVFSALFLRDTPGGPLRRLWEDRAESAEAFAGRLEGMCLAGGSGAARYRERLQSALGERFRFAADGTAQASAGAVAAVGALLLEEGRTAELLALEPVYIRHADAKRRQERH